MEVETAAVIVPDANAAPAPAPAPASLAPEAVAPAQADRAPTDAAPAAEAPPPAPVSDAQPKVPKSLLDKFDEKKAAESAPADAPKPDEVKAEPAPAEEPKPTEPAPEPEKAPVEEPVKLDPLDWFAEEGGLKIPEVISLDNANRSKLTTALELGRTDPKAGAQALMDMHAEALDQYAADLHTKMWTEFGKTREGWTTKVMADPELGGAGHDTAMGRSARMRDAFVSRHAPGTPAHTADMADWKDFLDTTGAGDHPAFHRLLNNVARKHDEAAPPPPNPTPPKDLGRKPGTKGLAYTHPTSQPGN